MLAHESIYCVSVPGGNAEVSLNRLRAILGAVETELHHSEIYGQMLSSLSSLPDEMNRQVRCMVKAVGREAIRLALRKLVRKKPSVAVRSVEPGFASAPSLQTSASNTLPPAPPLPHTSPSLKVIDSDVDRSAATTTPIAADAPPPRLINERVIVYPPAPPSVTKRLHDTPRKKISKKELALQAALQARAECLQALGQTLRQVRQEKSWSAYHLQIKTQIPMHQLEALETGQIDRLPEDIYLRGFIRQAGNALGLDGNQMANSLPAIDSATAVVPSWQQRKAKSGLRLNSAHVYLGYAALMAGGIAWVSHQSAPNQPSSVLTTPPATVMPPQKAPAPTSNAKANQNTAIPRAQQRVTTPGSISPPEVSPL